MSVNVSWPGDSNSTTWLLWGLRIWFCSMLKWNLLISMMFYRLCGLVGWMCDFNSWVVKGQGRHGEDLGAASCSTWFRTGIFHSASGIWTCFYHILTQHHSQPALESFLCIFLLLLWKWIVQCKCLEKLWGSFCVRFWVPLPLQPAR